MDFPCLTLSCAKEVIEYYAPNMDVYLAATMTILSTVMCLIFKLSLTKCLPFEDWPRDASEDLSDLNFDFIIVGAGSAGSVLANRLTEVPTWRVLLIEAGDDPPFISTIPAMAIAMLNSQYDWKYSSVNDSRTCKSYLNGECVFPRGKMLGGTSSLNSMIYVRGNPKDYDDIAANGNPGWEYKNILKYFIKSETLDNPEIKRNPSSRGFHGYKGPLNVKPYSKYDKQPMIEPLIDAFEELGSPINSDINGPSQLGTVRHQATIKGGRRESTATAYLISAGKRPNLIIWKRSFVTNVLFKGNVATGVRVILKDNQVVQVNASKEVILSAGTFNTPKLLMLSGIGPRKHLERKNIKVLVDLPVGKNLFDHFMVPTMMGCSKGVTPLSYLLNAALYVANKTGILAQVGVSELQTLINTNGGNPQPDIQIVPIYLEPGDFSTLNFITNNNLGYNQRTVNDFIALNKKTPILFFYHVLLNSRSRGRVLLRNTDPKSSPKIYPNYLSEEKDLETLIAGIEYTTKLIDTKSLRMFNLTLLPFDIEECKLFRFPSKPYWRCVIHNLGQSGWHSLGTAKMGNSTDPTSVVDPFLRVHGVDRLRVVDGSVIPSRISGNTNAPIIMFAEKASDLIKAHWQYELNC